jgi:hypothetical protein
MDTADLVRKVQRTFGDDDQIFILVDDIIDWANDAQMQIARETDCFTLKDTFVANTDSWPFPSDFLKVRRVTYGDVPLTKVDIEALDAIFPVAAKDSTPHFYFFSERTLTLYPAAVNTDSTVVTVYYSGQPVTLINEATQLTVPLQYHEDVVRFCVARAHERNENYRGMEIAMAEFNSRVAQRVEDQNQPEDSYSIIRDDIHDISFDVSWY